MFVLDQKGKVIIWRNYRGEVSPSVVEKFVMTIVEGDESNVKPVFSDDGVCYCWIKVSNLYFLALTQRNSNALMILAYLYKLADTLREYFRVLDEESLKDNFVLTYELFDEMMDNGVPQVTEVKILKEFIKTESLLSLVTNESTALQVKPPTAVTNAVSWRNEGIKYKKNEIFLDVVEKVNVLVSAGGQVLRSEVIGVLRMKSFLSGMPELKLGLNDKLLFDGGNSTGKAVEMEDIKFHQCVRLARFESDRTIAFIPPDGEFELMSYRLNTQVKPLIWVETVVDKSKGKSRIEFIVKARSQFKTRSVANNVEIYVPVPSDADTPQFKVSVGSAWYDPERDALVWSIKQFQGGKDFIMTASFGLPSISGDHRDAFLKRPITVKFEIPYFTASGLTIRFLKIVEKSGYQALPWVRYITQHGDYQLRMT